MNGYGSNLLKIGIFYDGNYFYHVSNYYCYAHPRRARLSIPGLHEFIKRSIAGNEGIDSKFCQIVDCHYFRGRLPAMEANARQILLNERVFDDILMREGVVTHYLPLSRQGGEKGIDVWLALEALELTIFKKFNILVLIASDSDYVPLVRKLNSLGTRVMVLGWDFEYMDDNGNTRYTCTSSKMMNEVSYPIWMDKVIDDDGRKGDPLIDSLFVPSQHSHAGARPSTSDGEEEQQPTTLPEAGAKPAADSQRKRGRIVQLKNGYGFISTDTPGKNLFFFWEDVEDADFNDLAAGDTLEYELGANERGECAKHVALVE